jgi:tetratricopeptide (TPR) repeat protein
MSKFILSFFLGLLMVGCISSPTDDKNTLIGGENDSLLLLDTITASAGYYQGSSDLSLDELCDLAGQNLEEKNYAYAKHYLQIASEIDSLDSRVLDMRGVLLLMTNRSQSADRIWKKCIQKYPGEIDCRIHLAELQLTLALNREALKLANELIQIDKNRPEGFFLKGMAIRALNNDTTQSIPYFQQAVDLKNDYIEALDMLGYIFAQRKDSLALAYYDNILKLDPTRSDIYFKKGVFYMAKKDWNKAMASYETAIKMNPQDADSYYNLGYVLTELKLYDKARIQFSRSIEAAPRNYKAHYGRAYTAEMLGDISNAMADYKEVLVMRPNHTPSKEGIIRLNKLMSIK